MLARPRVGVVGASGYSGVVATRLLAAHPGFALAFATSDRWVDEGVRARTGAATELTYVSNDAAVALAGDVQAVLLATSAEVSMALAPQFLSRGVRVVDLSGAFRLADAGAYPRWYRFTHERPALLAESHYGLPELFGAPAGRRLIANPGCYATAAILPLAPLLRARLIEPESIAIDGKSGVTGAGRQGKEDYSFVEVDGDVRAYKVHGHQHTPEIAQALCRHAGAAVSVVFTAHLLPIRRGLLCTAYARATSSATAAQIDECLRAAYADAPFVHVMKPELATLARVVGTNDCAVGVSVDDRSVVAVGALDNLLKGAAGQAVQNLDLAFGLDERFGLDGLHRSTP